MWDVRCVRRVVRRFGASHETVYAKEKARRPFGLGTFTGETGHRTPPEGKHHLAVNCVLSRWSITTTPAVILVVVVILVGKGYTPNEIHQLLIDLTGLLGVVAGARRLAARTKRQQLI